MPIKISYKLSVQLKSILTVQNRAKTRADLFEMNKCRFCDRTFLTVQARANHERTHKFDNRLVTFEMQSKRRRVQGL